MPASFHWLNITQFLGALNDNIFKFIVMFALISYFGDTNASTIVSVVGMLFVIPFIIISPPAGILADRISKQRITIFVKLLEIVIMTAGTIAFLLRLPYLIYGVLFLMSAQSAFFGPAKYGILPELVETTQLSRANSIIVCFTFLAIIFGTFLAPVTSALTHSNYGIASVLCIIIAIAGAITSFRILPTVPSGSTKKFSLFVFKDVFCGIRDFRHDHYLMFAIFGSMYYYLAGAYLQLNLIPYGIEILNLTHEHSSYLFLIAAIGIGIGSIGSGKLSARHFEFSSIIFGAIGLIIGLAGLYRSSNLISALIFVLFLGISSGLLIIPLQSLIQFRSPPQYRGSLLAASNVLNWIAILFASVLLYYFNAYLVLSPKTGFIIFSIMTASLFLIAFFSIPYTRYWIVNFWATHSRFVVYVHGIDAIPLSDTVIILCPTPSWHEALAAAATISRPIQWHIKQKTSFSMPRYVALLIAPHVFSRWDNQSVHHIPSHILFISGETILEDLPSIQSHVRNSTTRIIFCSIRKNGSLERKNKDDLHVVFSDRIPKPL